MALKTVKVPKEFEPIFARAEEVVESYFAGCSHDPSRAAIEIGGERYILVRAASLSTEFFSLVRRLFGAGRKADADEFGRNMLFDLAHAIGKSDADNFHAKMHLEDPLARLSAGPVHFCHSGWAFVDISPDSHPTPDKDYCLIYEHPNSFEADAWLCNGLKSDAPVCVMNAGYSSGWCETSFGMPLVAVEILCRAKGDSCCRFIMAPPDTIAEQVDRHLKCQRGHLPKTARNSIPELFARKRLEDELQRSEQKFRDLAERSFDIIVTVDAEGRFTYVSPAIKKVLGYSPAEAIGKHFTELLAESSIDRVSDSFAEAFKNPTSQCFELEAIRKDGSRATIEVTGVPILNDGNMVGAQGTARDITDRIRMENALQEQTVAIRRAQEETIHRLVSASLWRDEETGMHIRRTALLSEFLAQAAGWSASDAGNIRLAAPMHDVGKIGIPDAILRKPGKLTPEEFEIMKTHTIIGSRMLSGSDAPMLRMAAEIALNHHERWDGKGYPAGLAGNAIPESARILAIVDVYDSLSHNRVYRLALPEEKVIAIMQQGEGTHFDPSLLAFFFTHLDRICRIAQEHPDEWVESEFTGHPLSPTPLDMLAVQQIVPAP